MDTRVQEELELIGKLELDTLRARYKGITGREPGELGRTFMTRRVAYAAQVELTRQDLTPTDRGILMAIANHDPAVNPKCRPTERRKLETSRASFVKVYKGVRHIIKPDGEGHYIYVNDGRTYASPTTIARMITQSHVNGRVFFGMK